MQAEGRPGTGSHKKRRAWDVHSKRSILTASGAVCMLHIGAMFIKLRLWYLWNKFVQRLSVAGFKWKVEVL